MNMVRKYFTALLTVIVTVAAIGVPVALYKCVICNTVRTESCCAPQKSNTAAHLSTIQRLPCTTTVMLASPLRENTPPQIHKSYSADFTPLAIVPDNSPVNHFYQAYSFQFIPGEFLPPPLLLTEVLRI
jgi:hypothetical protein